MRIAFELERARELASGGVFVVGCELPLNSDCTLAIGELEITGRIVFVDARGAGIELVGFGAAMKQQLVALAEQAEATPPATEPGIELELVPEPEPEGEPLDARAYPETLQQKLRGLSLAEAVKKAHSGDPTERILLERMYGKNVWEALLRNPRLTVPEVTRIARMATLPKTMIEIIISNGAWLQIPEIRRALLGNPRLGTDQIVRVLRMLPKTELKVAGSTPAYSHAVRDAAKRMFREGPK